VVEDDLAVGEALAGALDRENIQTTCVAGGRAALAELCRATAEADAYDAIVLDICMPDINGWQVLEAVKSNPLWQHTMIVAISGFVNGPNDVARVCRYDGVYVEKKGDFLQVVRAALARLVSAA